MVCGGDGSSCSKQSGSFKKFRFIHYLFPPPTFLDTVLGPGDTEMNSTLFVLSESLQSGGDIDK